MKVDGIDRRVVVESWLTHSGLKKKALYFEGLDLPEVTFVLADLSYGKTSWERENMQRNAILEGLKNAAADDIVLISDVDEVPTSDAITRAIQQLKIHPAVVLSQKLYNFSKDWMEPGGWRGTVVTTAQHVKKVSPQQLRDDRERLPRVADGGEHLSWFGGVGEVRRKLRSFAHEEYASYAENPDVLKENMEAGRDLFGRWSLQPTTEGPSDNP